MAIGKRLDEEFALTGDDAIDEVWIRRLLKAIEARLRPVEEKKASFEDAEALLIQVGLSRINETLAPATERIIAVTELGFLIANSATPALLVEDATTVFTLASDDQAGLFTPSPFVALTRAGSPDDFAIAQTLNFDRGLLELRVKIVAVVGNPGPHSDWVIGAMAGPTIASITAMTEALEARAVIDAAMPVITEARATVVDLHAEVDMLAATTIAYADTPENVPIAPGVYSVRHWAAKAIAAAGSAVNALIKGNNLSDLTDKPAALGNLGFSQWVRENLIAVANVGAARTALGAADASKVALKDTENQVLTGGFRVTAKALATPAAGATVTLDPGGRMQQTITNNAAFTIPAPTQNGEMVLLMTNGSTPGAVTFSGFTVSSDVGDEITLGAGDKFRIAISRIAGTATYHVKALQG